MTISSPLSAAFPFTLAATALAQPCVPGWDTSLGQIGVTSDGYIAPIVAYDDGRGEALYVGGSFDSVGGYFTRGIARHGGGNLWQPVGGGCYSTNTNYFLTTLLPADLGQGSELLAAGGFGTAGGVANTANLAAWNGTRWRSLGIINSAVWALAVQGDTLYAAGGFTSAGGTPVSGIAAYDGNSWSAMGTGMEGGFSPSFFALKVFNDGSSEKLYAGGRFNSVSGVTGLVARWNGAVWEPVGRGVRGTNTFSGIETMTVFNDGTGNALYCGGWDLRPVGQNQTVNVVKWDGTRWSNVGQYLGGRTTALAVFDDGSGAGPQLYSAGTAQPGIAYLARLIGNTWTTVDGGVGQPGGPPWPSVFGLYAHGDRLYVGGDFDYVGLDQREASGLAARISCANLCPPDFNNDGFLDFFDYADFVACFEGSCSPGGSPDFNDDGFTDFFDYAAFVEAFEAGC
jgi:hypothetical protein